MQGQRLLTQQNSNLLIKENEQTIDYIIICATKLNWANEQLNEKATQKTGNAKRGVNI